MKYWVYGTVACSVNFEIEVEAPNGNAAQDKVKQRDPAALMREWHGQPVITIIETARDEDE